MLLVSDGPESRELRDRLTPGRYVRCSDPYDALLKMSRRRWSTVVLAATMAGFSGLCRASRRLQCDAKLYAVCPPALEPEVRSLRGEVLDDYFIYPPSAGDVRRMSSADRQAPPPAEAAGKGGASPAPASGLGAADIASLVGASRTVAGLEDHLAGELSARLGFAVQWIDANGSGEGRRPLLLAANDSPRVLVASEAAHEVAPGDQALLSAVQHCLPALLANARHVEKLQQLAITDYLTGAYNRRYFYHLTDEILRRATSKSFRVALLLFDIDDFKRYNDAYSHAAGDEILREVARLIKGTTRSQDIVARIGGDEFTVLFWDNAGPRQPNSEMPTTAQVMAERFRAALAKHTFPSLGPEARGVLTISGGLATFPTGGTSCRELLRSADGALRDAKVSGKNAIHLIG
jgi:diguanylate cyclase (GGDEF)-like protein